LSNFKKSVKKFQAQLKSDKIKCILHEDRVYLLLYFIQFFLE